MRREFKNRSVTTETCPNEEKLIKLRAVEYQKALLANTLLRQFKGRLPPKSEAYGIRKKDIKIAHVAKKGT